MFKVDDRVRETSVTVGAGTYTLAGAPVGYQAFSSLTANNYCPYFATDDTGWETGIGRVLTGPDRLERTHIWASSNADAAVVWAGTTVKIRCGLPASMAFPRVKTVGVGGGAGTQVLTQEEQRCQVLLLTGVLTGNRNIEVDSDTPWTWMVFNNTSGAFNITLRATGQTGFALGQGRRIVAYHDGVDVRQAAPSAAAQAVASEFAAGTAVVFQQTAAPLGWTKSATHNDKALRVVSGTAGSGGATAFTTVFNGARSTNNFTLTGTEMPSHGHGINTVGDSTGDTGGSGYCYAPGAVNRTAQGGSNANAAGSGGAHAHTIGLDLQYMDVIVATKDA